MGEAHRAFVPAAGHPWFLPLYDPLTTLLGFDNARRELIVQAAVQPGHRVLDVGCGTGTLAIQIRKRHPDVDVTALDPDMTALARANRKATRAGVSVRFDLGFSEELPYADATFDRVFSSMMFHHLAPGVKEATLAEIRRVLKPGGRLHMLDFGGPDAHAHTGLARWLHSHELMRDNGEGRVLGLMADTGLVAAKKVSERRVWFGQLAYYQAARHL